MVERRAWKEFKESGLFWFVNSILHAFGWSLVMEVDDNGTIIKCYPARVKFRGFVEEVNTQGYQKLSKYMKDNASELLEESMN